MIDTLSPDATSGPNGTVVPDATTFFCASSNCQATALGFLTVATLVRCGKVADLVDQHVGDRRRLRPPASGVNFGSSMRASSTQTVKGGVAVLAIRPPT